MSILNKNVPIVFICDEKYAMPTSVAITSLLENKNKDTVYEIIVIGVDLSVNAVNKLNALHCDNCTIKIINNNNKYNNYEFEHDYVSKASLYKFDIPEILNDYDKVLYLDSDIIILKDLSELLNTDLEGYYAGVIKDFIGETIFRNGEEIGVDNYFNSGVMLLNIKKMRNNNLFKEFIDYRINQTSKQYMDQDAFNYVFKNNVKFLSPLYNYMTTNNVYSKGVLCDYYNVKSLKNPYILHITYKKPWEYNNIDGGKEWIKYYNLSPYKSEKLIRKKFKDVKKRGFIYKEKIWNKRIWHIGFIKISYVKWGGGNLSAACRKGSSPKKNSPKGEL